MPGILKEDNSLFEIPIEKGINLIGVVFIDVALAADNENIEAWY